MNLRPKPDFAFANEKANEMLICSEKVQRFPLSVYEIIMEETDLNLMTFNEARSNDIKPEKLGSSSGVLVDLGGFCTLLYNERESRQRISFDCAHELGHYQLNHDLKELDCLLHEDQNLHRSLYDVCEIEANFFAAQLLMPEQVIIELCNRGCRITNEFLQEKFGVSEQAAIKRLDTLRKVYNWNSFRKNNKNNYDDIIIKKFKSFIVSVAPNRYTYEEEYEMELAMQKERDSWI